MSLAQAYQNFGYRVGAISATESALCSLRFREYDPFKKGNTTQGTGGMRRFFVEFIEGDELSGATNMVSREAEHEVRLHVDYPRKLELAEMYRLILADLDDIITALREANQSNLNGYSAATDTTDVGLFGRVYQGYEINKSNPDVWRLTTGWRIAVRESEI